MMAIVDHVATHEMVRTFAEAIKDEPSVRRFWAWTEPSYIEPGRDYVELWLLTDPIDPETDRRLGMAAMRLHERFPEDYIRMHTMTTEMLGGREPAGAIREGAVEIPLRSA